MIVSLKYVLPIVFISLSTLSFNTQAYPKGKPFKVLKNLIDQNTAAIEANSKAIQSFNSRTERLDNNVREMSSELMEIKRSVESNTDHIQLAFEKLDDMKAELEAEIQSTYQTASSSIQSLKLELLEFIHSTELEISTNREALIGLRLELAQMSLDNSAIAQELREQLLTLSASTESNSESSVVLQAQLTTLTTVLATLNSEFNTLSTLYMTLDSILNEHQSELAELTVAVNHLANASQSDTPDGSDPIESFTFTDEYLVTDIEQAVQVREFFNQTPTDNRYVHAVFNTVSMNKITEFCIQDNDNVFDALRIDGDHNSGIRESSDVALSSYRLNNEQWIDSLIKVRSTKSGGYSEIEIASSNASTAGLYLVDRVDNDPYGQFEIRHQNSWLTVSAQAETQVTFTVADDRFSACGY